MKIVLAVLATLSLVFVTGTIFGTLSEGDVGEGAFLGLALVALTLALGVIAALGYIVVQVWNWAL